MYLEIKKVISLDKGSIEVSRDGNEMRIVYKNCYESNRNIIKLINEILPIIDVTFSKLLLEDQSIEGTENEEEYIPPRYSDVNWGTLQEVIDNMIYSFNLRDTLINLRSNTVQKYNSPIIKELEIRLLKIKHFIRYEVSEKLSFSEKLVLSKLGDLDLCASISDYDLRDYYNAKEFSLSPKLDEIISEVNSFDYQKYGCDKDELTKEFNEGIAKFKNDIFIYESLVKEHGDQIIDWSNHKMTYLKLDYGTVRQFIVSYQESLREKGIQPKPKQIAPVVKTRAKEDKQQVDYIRLFKSGSLAESHEVLPHLNIESLATLISLKTESGKERVRHNRDAILALFCKLDDGSRFSLVNSWSHDPLPLDYLFKAFDKGGDKDLIRHRLYNLRSGHSNFPDKFFDGILANRPWLEILDQNYYVTDAVVSRMTRDEKIDMVKMMAGEAVGFKGLGLGGCVDKEDKLDVSLDIVTIQKWDPSIYAEIKDYIPELSTGDQHLFSSMIVANRDKEAARNLIESDCGELVELYSIFDYSERLQIFKEVSLRERSYLRSDSRKLRLIFNEAEQLDAFKELLKMNLLSSQEVLLDHWNYLVNSKKNKKEYVNLLETIPSAYAPISSDMSKRTRLILTNNGVTVSHRKDLVSDFTREELLERFDVYSLRKLAIDKLTAEELIDYGEQDENFLKENISLYPSEYLQKRFGNEEYRKKFIGNRVLVGNKRAERLLLQKLGLSS